MIVYRCEPKGVYATGIIVASTNSKFVRGRYYTRELIERHRASMDSFVEVDLQLPDAPENPSPSEARDHTSTLRAWIKGPGGELLAEVADRTFSNAVAVDWITCGDLTHAWLAKLAEAFPELELTGGYLRDDACVRALFDAEKKLAQLCPIQPSGEVATPTDDDGRWITQAEVAKRLGLVGAQVERLRKKGSIQDNGRTGRDLRIDKLSAIQYTELKGLAWGDS